jgi:hypothetical protein
MKQSSPGSSAMGCGIRRRSEIFFLDELPRRGLGLSENRKKKRWVTGSVGNFLGDSVSQWRKP